MLATEERVSSEKWVLRLGGWAAIVGALMGMVGNLLHPATPIGDPLGTAEVIAGSTSWIPLHLVIVLGIFLMLLGLLALYRSVEGGLPEALAQFGMVAAVAGITIGLLLVIMDGVGASQLAEEWAQAQPVEQVTALRILAANETINFSLASLFNFVFAGATFILFGLAVALSDQYPSWFGWVAVAAGVLSVGAGLVQAYNGEPTAASRTLTIIGPTVITLWLLAIGTSLVRRSGEAREIEGGIT